MQTAEMPVYNRTIFSLDRIASAPLVEPMTKYGRTAILVELSILIHSVIVGFDLGLQDVNSWRTLVVAIAFSGPKTTLSPNAKSYAPVDAGVST